VQIITHFLSPVVNPNDIGPKPPRSGDATWQSAFDRSRVWVQKKGFTPAGFDASCPNGGAVGGLLLPHRRSALALRVRGSCTNFSAEADGDLEILRNELSYREQQAIAWEMSRETQDSRRL
jgi:hypothetical protein